MQKPKCEVVDCPNTAHEKMIIADGSGGRWLCRECASTPDPRIRLRFPDSRRDEKEEDAS